MLRLAWTPLLALLLGLSIAAAAPLATSEARLVPAEVRFNGEVLLEASTSDDGQPNVDQVWAYLAGLRFSATPEFEALRTARERGDDTCTLSRGEEDDWIELEISYGGRAQLRKLSLLKDGEFWRLAPAQPALEATAAARRWIRRSAVDGLTKKSRR